MRWVTATTCTSSPTPRAASLLKHTIWESAAWWLRELNRLPGLAWRENFSVIGRAQSALEKSLSFLSTMPALLVLCSCGRRSYWVPLKSRARSFLADEAKLVGPSACPSKERGFHGYNIFERKRYDTKGNDLTEPPLQGQTRSEGAGSCRDKRNA